LASVQRDDDVPHAAVSCRTEISTESRPGKRQRRTHGQHHGTPTREGNDVKETTKPDSDAARTQREHELDEEVFDQEDQEEDQKDDQWVSDVESDEDQEDHLQDQVEDKVEDEESGVEDGDLAESKQTDSGVARAQREEEQDKEVLDQEDQKEGQEDEENDQWGSDVEADEEQVKDEESGVQDGDLAIPREHAVEDAAQAQLVEDHVRIIWCRGNQTQGDYLLDWMAHLVQRPGVKMMVVPVIRGGQGAGKSIITYMLGAILGPVKTLSNFIVESNSDSIIRRGGRPWLCLEVDNKYAGQQTDQSRAYFDALGAVDPRVFAYMLYNRDISGFKPHSMAGTGK
jgi:hypothetical protein